MWKDALKGIPDTFNIMLENDDIRLLELWLKPGDKSGMHSHPDLVAHALTDCRCRFTLPSGSTREVDMKKGQTIFQEAVTHNAENIGNTEAHILILEMKQSPDA